MENNIQIVRLSDDNFHDFHSLFNTVFKRNMPLESLKRKYNTAYLGEQYYQLGYLAYSKGQAIGFCGLIPQLMQINEKQMVILQSCDHMVLDTHRGQGVFKRVGMQASTLAKSLGVPFEIGFPNQNNHPVMIHRLDWKFVHQLYAFQISIQTLPILSIVNRISFIQSLYKQRIEAVLDKYLTTNFFTDTKYKGLVRDIAFYEYKASSRAYSLQLPGLKIWLKIDSNLTIGDIWLENEADFEKGVTILKRIAKRIGARKIIFLLSENHPAYALLKQYATPHKGNALLVRYTDTEMDIDWNRVTFSRGDYDTF